MEITLGIIGTPFTILVIGSVKIQEVREEAACRHLAGKLVEIVVRVLWEIVDTPFLFPYLDGEDGGLAIAHSLIGTVQQLTHDATSLGRGVSTIVDAGEYYLVTPTGVDGIHIMDECLHRLVDTSHRLVDGMLTHSVDARQLIEGLFEIIHEHLIIELTVVLSVEVLQCLQLLDIGQTHIGSQIEVEGRNSLTAMHLVLGTFQRDTGKDGCRLNTLGRTAGTMTGNKTLCQDIVERVLYTGQ